MNKVADDRVDVIADLNAEDDDGLGWSTVSAASNRSSTATIGVRT